MKRIYFIFLVALLFGCSSGGSGGDNSSTDVLFSTTPDGYYQEGYKESYSITGTDTRGGRYTGNFYINTRERTMIDGSNLTPLESLFNLTNTANNVFISALSTTYIGLDKNPVLMINHESGVTYTPVSIGRTPETAEIGSIGALTTWSGDDGTVMSGNWALEKNENANLADLVSMMTIKNQLNEIIVYQEMIQTIEKTGAKRGLKIKWQYPGTGLVINLTGTKT